MGVQEVKRKIVQISAIPDTSTQYETVYALCDDHTVWRIVLKEEDLNPVWVELPPIPNEVKK
jgi:hypothetical protein